MTIHVVCDCGASFDTTAANAGKRARCPDCGREFRVPAIERKPEPEPAPAVVFIDDGPPRTSVNAYLSLLFGLFFVFACLTGIPAILLGVSARREIARRGGRLRGRAAANVGIGLGVVGCLFTVALLLPATRSAREAARRAQCVNNLKQIGLGLHNYEAVYGCLPPAAICDRDGRPLLSWRVAILPFLEANALWSKFRLDEPWNSPHNQAVAQSVGTPLVYRCPSDAGLPRDMTGYVAVVGRETAFRSDRAPVRFSDITDGLSSTIAVGETTRHVLWTKPDDLPYDMNVPQAGLGSRHGYHNNGFNVLMVDGSVRFLKSTVAPIVLRGLLTPAGGEVISDDEY
jgi:prepilin-type processing-associated H-X9-DG protein